MATSAHTCRATLAAIAAAECEVPPVSEDRRLPDGVVDRRDPTRPDRRRFPRQGGQRRGDPPADWVSVTAFAKRYGVSRGKVYEWLAAEILWTYTVGPLLRIRNLPPDDHPAAKALHVAK